MTVHYKNGIRVETSEVIMYINHDQNKGYIISVTDKETNKLTYKIYRRKRNINQYANKYGIAFVF